MERAFPSASIQALTRGEPQAVGLLVDSLTKRGFALVDLGSGDDSTLLRQALMQSQSRGEFRFPPVDKPVQYQEPHKVCFRTLFGVARQCLGAILRGHREFAEASPTLLGALEESFSPSYRLFGEKGEENYPFASNEVAFATSFFNIFDYDYGLLNAHRDRCLVTVIFVNQLERDNSTKSALWVKGASGEWVNADSLVGENEVIVLLGEDFEALAKSMGVSLWAAEHCIRVDPNGENLERAHHRPDPDTLESGNRMSAALILSHEGGDDD